MADVELVRLRNVATGAVVQVREGKALGAEWVPVVEVEAEKPSPRRRPAKQSDNE